MTIHTVKGLEIDEWVSRAEAAEAEVARLVAFLKFNRGGRPRQAGPTLKEIADCLAALAAPTKEERTMNSYTDLFARAEMRWMSVEDSEMTVRARTLAEIGREMAALRAALIEARDWINDDEVAEPWPPMMERIDAALADKEGT